MNYWLLLPLNLLIAFFAVLFSPLLPMFATTEGWLPKCLNWFQTPDASIDGDNGWRSSKKHPIVNKLPRYFRRVLWLLRNPSYGFNWTVLASKPLPKEWKFKGDITCDRSLGKTSWVYITCGGYWHFRCYLKYPNLNYCCQLNMGWDIHELCVNGKHEGHKAKYRFTPHPLKKMI